MRFWDSSAVVPLLVRQAGSDRSDAWFAEDPAIALWTLTPIETVSAVRRLVRAGSLEESRAHTAETRLAELYGSAYRIVDVEGTKATAVRLLRVHTLRAADALQLGAAVLWANGRAEGRVLHTLDDRLALAARREGFLVPAPAA